MIRLSAPVADKRLRECWRGEGERDAIVTSVLFTVIRYFPVDGAPSALGGLSLGGSKEARAASKYLNPPKHH